MFKEAIFHKTNSEYAYSLSKDKILLKIRTKKGDCNLIEVHYVDKYKFLFFNQRKINIKTMIKKYTDDLFDYYESELDFDMLNMGYFFYLENKDEKIYYGNYKFFNTIDSNNDKCYLPELFIFPVLDETDLFKVPKWAEEGIVYQIFPERFYRGNNYIKNKNHGEWYSESKHDIYLGGNLKGIIDKLDYLEELGINIIYLNPIFKAEYTHKYCTIDYMQIDPDFGTIDTLKELVIKSHSKGIKVLLDGVFSSTGLEFHNFKDVLENGEKSDYKDWFKIDKFPIEVKSDPNYKCFAYFPILPKVNYSSEGLKKYFLDVLKFWIEEADIDGWRLDVADEIPQSFWREARKVVKEENPDALLVGEIWADSRSWLGGDQLDSVMNYRFYDPLLNFIGKEKITAEEFYNEQQKVFATYKKQTHKILWNLIDSHDTPRFLTESSSDKRKLKLAALLQFTFIGNPVIYYGDEAGIEGGKDPDNRRGMLWDEDKRDEELFKFYKNLSKIRRENKELIYGELKLIYINNDKGILAYERELNEIKIQIYINNGKEDYTVRFTDKKINLIDNKEYEGEYSLKSKEGIILK